MKPLTMAVVGAAMLVAGAVPAQGQTWTGFYVGASGGAAIGRDKAAQRVVFDTNLDGTFTDTVNTAAGANAFSPGFCNGRALTALPGDGCTADENGMDFGGRVGYDRQMGRVVLGALVDVGAVSLTDGVAAFSTTPAFYTFTREINYVSAVRARVGVGNGRMLVYGTGGGAWANIDQTFTTSNGVNTFVPGKDAARAETSMGYQAGAGVEFRVAGGLTLTGEYLFNSFDDREQARVRSQGPAPATNPFILVNGSGTDLQPEERLTFQGVRVGLNVRF